MTIQRGALLAKLLGTSGLLVCATACTGPLGPRIFGLFPVQSEDAGAAIAQRWGGVTDSGQDVDRLNTLTRRIATAVPELDVPCRCVLLASQERAALSLSDGRVFVSRGLYEQSTDAQLAGILAHEIAHIAAGDGQAPATDSASQFAMELRADQRALEYLVAAGLPVEGLAQALYLVSDEQPSGWADVRIRALNDQEGVLLAANRMNSSARFTR